ncbi:hypothetical protein BH20ACI4_BH20ACI4_04500 [soil metagenome]
MSLPNTTSQISPDSEQNNHKKQIIADTLESEIDRIKRYIRISLKHLNIFDSLDELNHRTEDVFQQTAFRALKKSGDFIDGRSPFSWINGFAANVVKQEQNRFFRDRETFDDDFEDLEKIEKLRREIETTALPEETFWEKAERDEDERIRFEGLISKLKDDYRKILRLHYFEDINIMEIAAQLGKNMGAAQRQLNRAEKKLREILGGKKEKK